MAKVEFKEAWSEQFSPLFTINGFRSGANMTGSANHGYAMAGPDVHGKNCVWLRTKIIPEEAASKISKQIAFALTNGLSMIGNFNTTTTGGDGVEVCASEVSGDFWPVAALDKNENAQADMSEPKLGEQEEFKFKFVSKADYESSKMGLDIAALVAQGAGYDVSASFLTAFLNGTVPLIKSMVRNLMMRVMPVSIWAALMLPAN